MENRKDCADSADVGDGGDGGDGGNQRMRMANDLAGFEQRVKASLDALGDTRDAIREAAMVVEKNGGIMRVGGRDVKADSSGGVTFRPKIRASDDDPMPFQRVLNELMKSSVDPRERNTLVSRGEASAEQSEVDSKGRRVLTYREVKEIAKRARGNYRTSREGNSVLPPAYNLELRVGDRLCVLANGKTLEEFLAGLAKQEGAMPILSGRYAEDCSKIPESERDLMAVFADSLSRTRIPQPKELVEAVFLGETGDYKFVKVGRMEDLKPGDVCAVVFPSIPDLRARRGVFDIDVGTKLGTAHPDVKFVVVTSDRLERYADDSGLAKYFVLRQTDVQVQNGCVRQREGFEIRFDDRDVNGPSGRERVSVPPDLEIVFKVVKKNTRTLYP